MAFHSFNSGIDINWNVNEKNMQDAARNADTTQIDYRFVDYQQKWQTEREIERLITASATNNCAEIDVYYDVGDLLELSASKLSSAKIN
jgi:hypothetical protein